MYPEQSNAYEQLDLLTQRLTENTFIFFRTKRGLNNEILTAAEKKIYDAIAYKGISIGKLARQTNLSTRVTYRCIKHLKGKKLVFQRRTPKTYDLTDKGRMLATMLFDLKQTVEDAWSSFQQTSQEYAITRNIGELSDKSLCVKPIGILT